MTSMGQAVNGVEAKQGREYLVGWPRSRDADIPQTAAPASVLGVVPLVHWSTDVGVW
jgi:hypothetical protein